MRNNPDFLLVKNFRRIGNGKSIAPFKANKKTMMRKFMILALLLTLLTGGDGTKHRQVYRRQCLV